MPKKSLTNRLGNISRNLRMVGDVAKIRNKEAVNKELDRMINTVHIFYKSKQDFIDNFPDNDDINGKIRLIINRRR